MDRVINAGYIGVGSFMHRMHLPHTFQNPKYRVHTLCDLDEALLEERREQYKPLKTTTDYHDVLNDPEIDLVFIGTRGDLHKKFIVEAAKAEKNIMVEKPMTQTLAESEEAVRAVVRNNVRCMVGFNRRFAPAMVEARRIFREMRGGAVNISYVMATDEMDDPGYYAFDLQKGGGHIVTEGCHILDLLCWFVGSEPVRIYAQGSLESDDNVVLTFADGSVAGFLLSRHGGLCYPKESMMVCTGRSTMAVDQFTEIRADIFGNSFVRKYFPAKWDAVHEVPGTMGVDGGIELHYQKSVVLRENDLYWERSLQPDKGHYAALDAFADCLLSGEPSPADEVDGARATYLGLKALDSIKTNQSQELNPEDYFLPLRR